MNDAKKMRLTIQGAKKLGQADGAEAVDSLVQEEGINWLQRACAPGQPSWDEAAINAGAFEQICSVNGMTGTKGAREAYYRAYEKAATERAAEILRAL